MKKKKNRGKPDWAEAKKVCRLNAAEIQMAKELGMGPKSLIKNIRNKSQPWKMPVKVWIRDLYFEKFGDREPQVPDVHEPATPMPLTSKPRRVVKPEQPCADEGSNTFPVSLFGETSDEEIPF